MILADRVSVEHVRYMDVKYMYVYVRDDTMTCITRC